MRLRTFALLAALLLPLPLVADTVTYTYTGNDFTSVSGSYTTSDFVSITFTLPAPLTDNFGVGPLAPNVVPLSWSISDGVQSNNSSNPIFGASFAITTNATGQIVDWHVATQFGSGGNEQIGSLYNYLGVDSQDDGQDPFAGGGMGSEGVWPATPGSWSGPVSSSPVPESPSFALLLLGGASLCAPGLFRFRSRPKSLRV